MITDETRRNAYNLLKTCPAIDLIALLDILGERIGVEDLAKIVIMDICTELREEEHKP